MTRRAWGRVGLVVLVVALPLGRWLALRTAGRAWAASLGATATHIAVDDLRLALFGLGFSAAAAWAVGNLYLLYRSIGSVHVPRRIGNIEILEAVPRKYLQLIMLGLGAVVAAALSVGARDWWMDFALAGAATNMNAHEPILGRELGYYLFTLPWQHRVLGFLARLVSIVLLLTAGLHSLIGAVRWTGRRLDTTDLARTHLAGQLAVLAGILFLQFRLDPAAYVGGLKNVPYDAILVDVRLPVSALLSGMALAAGVTSLAWIRVPRAVVVVVPWAALALVGLTGTYVVPGFAAAARSPEQRVRRDLVEAQRALLGYAYGGDAVADVVTVTGVPDPAVIARRAAEIAAVPLWDPPILQAILVGVGPTTGDERWTEPMLGVYPGSRDQVPVFVAVREPDLLARRAADPDMSWHDAHVGTAAFGTGAIAVAANAASALGLPLFVPSLAVADSHTSHVTELALRSPRVAFSPGAEEFAILESAGVTAEDVGVRVRGLGLRLALAWSLQSPQLLSSRLVEPDALLLWPRGIAERLERLAPFAYFGAPYVVVVRGRLHWLAPGYVTARAFPLSIATDFAGRRVRYARAGFLGVVDAHDGSTSLYLLPEPDLLSEAWAKLAPDIVRSAEQLPSDLVSHIRYPEALLSVQVGLAVGGGAGGLPSLPQRPVSEGPRSMWLVGSAGDAGAATVMLHASAMGESGALESVVQGVMERGVPRLSVLRLREPVVLGRSPVLEGTVLGRPRALVFPEGVVGVAPSFDAGGGPGGDLPRFREVTVESGAVVGRGRSYAEALAQLRSVMVAPPATGAQWSEVRRWFGRLDQARRTGDWVEFGRAWQELRRLLGMPRDTTP